MKRPRGSSAPLVKPTLRQRMTSGHFLASLAIHAAIVLALARFLISPTAFLLVFGRAKSPAVPAERIGFLVLPKATGTPVEGRSGGDGRPVSKTQPRRLVAPATVPTGISPAPTRPVTRQLEEGSGPLTGTGGPARGIRPTYSDPRLWTAPGNIVSAPRTAKERLDSVVASIVAPFVDSVAIAARQRDPKDWTFEKDGRKYGLDPQYIRLGKVSIPTALLGLLPINMTGNPTLNERNKLQNQLNADIRRYARQGMNEVDFKKAVKSIRERKERERAQAEKNARPADQPDAQVPPKGTAPTQAPR
ncbi:MAG: hypothetical protein H0T48_06685 [Gemmatimonadaceae bacterium]|nr:hypothetical protein [Gemmatimonadaceae bacterium]